METQQQQRTPYYVLRLFSSNLKIHEGILREIYPNNGHGCAIQIYLTDEEVQKYDGYKVYKILKPYIEITKKRYMYIPSELVFYAISEVLYA